jgi:hypothetical protein
MITSKQIIKISEDYLKGQRFGSNYVEVYVNPTKSELLLLSEPSKKNAGEREIRFVINPDERKIYVCDAYLGLHPYLRKMLNLNDDNDMCIIYGEAKYNGSNFTPINLYSAMFSMSRIVSKVPQYRNDVERFFKFDWTWTTQYVTGIENYVKSLKK